MFAFHDDTSIHTPNKKQDLITINNTMQNHVHRKSPELQEKRRQRLLRESGFEVVGC